MELLEERVGVTYVVTAKGRLDSASSPVFAERVGGLLNNPNPRLLIDFADVDFVTSAGLRVVLLLLKKTKAANGALALCSVRAPVRDVLDISGFSPMLTIHAARSEGIAALSV